MPARPVCPLPECAEPQCRGRRATHPGEYLEPDCRPCREPARLPRWPALPTADRNRGHTSRWGVACGSAVRTAHCAAVHATAGFQGGSFRAADDGRDRRYPSELSFRLLRHCPLHHSASLHGRSEEHTSELQSRENLVCRLLLE